MDSSMEASQMVAPDYLSAEDLGSQDFLQTLQDGFNCFSCSDKVLRDASTIQKFYEKTLHDKDPTSRNAAFYKQSKNRAPAIDEQGLILTAFLDQSKKVNILMAPGVLRLPR